MTTSATQPPFIAATSLLVIALCIGGASIQGCDDATSDGPSDTVATGDADVATTTTPPPPDADAGGDAVLIPDADGSTVADADGSGEEDLFVDEDADAVVPPPPGAIEGFGAVTLGHASSPTGSTDCHVTTLADDGSAGTLRDCLSEGDRRVVFDIGGTIVLTSDLNIRWSYVTVDGETAPAPGITIEQPGDIGTTVEARASTGPAHDIIVRYLRMDGQASTHLNAGDIWGLDGENDNVYNIVLDHISARAATDGIFDIYGNVRDVTISWSLMRDTITLMHSSTGDIAQTRERISFHHNVLANNNERQIRFRHDNQLIDYTNNVIYGWGWFDP